MNIVAPPFSAEPIPTVDAFPPDRPLGSPWRRLFAFLVDAFLVGVVSGVACIPFFEPLSRLGPWGRLIGFCIALPYFVILESRIGNGQTLGKRWLHLQLVDRQGNTISLGKSLIRSSLFAIPVFVNGLELPVTRTPWIISAVLSVLIFGLGGSTLYLLLFNRRTRQGVHDLAVGSYVAKADETGPLNKQAIWKTHWVILGALLVFFGLGAEIVAAKVAKSGPFTHMPQDAKLLENMEGVQRAGVQDLYWSNWGSRETKRILVINVFWTKGSANEEAFADRVSKLILQNDHEAQEHDLVRIVITRGYDLGISQAWVSHTFEHTPADWNNRVLGTSPAGVGKPVRP